MYGYVFIIILLMYCKKQDEKIKPFIWREAEARRLYWTVRLEASNIPVVHDVESVQSLEKPVGVIFLTHA